MSGNDLQYFLQFILDLMVVLLFHLIVHFSVLDEFSVASQQTEQSKAIN
uniref:Uncharacterized protein n=1 Tax=Meloidogyne enterolobii TaxID=390850 RepID=A0A6V7V322_MELEN|nr:unnamed protein product [Meloidogyne enterolobii]